jgi:hypothetical protein
VLSDPAGDLTGYLALWLTTALLGAGVCASGVWLRHRHGDDPLAKQRTWLAVSQFVPCLAAGGLVTLVIARHLPDHAKLLPGLWQVFFSLGVFASARPPSTRGRWGCRSPSGSSPPPPSCTGTWSATGHDPANPE